MAGMVKTSGAATRRMAVALRSIVLGQGTRTVTEAARALHVGRPALSRVLNGRAALSVEMAARIEDAFRYDALGLLQKQAELQLADHRAAVGSALLPVMWVMAPAAAPETVMEWCARELEWMARGRAAGEAMLLKVAADRLREEKPKIAARAAGERA
jgi:plasmid maintenance system antidote protein VapI